MMSGMIFLPWEKKEQMEKAGELANKILKSIRELPWMSQLFKMVMILLKRVRKSMRSRKGNLNGIYKNNLSN
jgi:hypothetical protein